MDLNEFDYNLPASNIAQHPVVPRDACRLMIVDRKNQTITHKSFMNLGDFLNARDLAIFETAVRFQMYHSIILAQNNMNL